MEEERRSTSARQNWRKVFAVRKFLSLAKFQSQQPPADLLVGQKYLVGKKIANGAFGQLRLARHIETNSVSFPTFAAFLFFLEGKLRIQPSV